MSIQDVAKDFTALCNAGKMHEAGIKYWAEDVASIEPMGEKPVTKGKANVGKKGDDWYAANKVESAKLEGPWVHGDQFVVLFDLAFTPKGQDTIKMKEVGVYTVKNDKITEERFYLP